MGMLSNIFHKIFPGSQQPAAPAPSPAAGARSSAAPAAGTAGAGSTAAGSTAAGPTPAAASAAAPGLTPVTPLVDVEVVLMQMARQAPQPLNWRTSIVDLLKLLNLDSSLNARKELADELHYNGDRNDSAAMNIWLHRQVMIKLAENGGKVPAELRH
jgi:hypothetical protein